MLKPMPLDLVDAPVKDPPPPFFPPAPLCSDSTFYAVSIFIVSVTLVMTLMTNILIIKVTFRTKRKTINPYPFLSLAMCNLLMGLFVLPFSLIFALMGENAYPSFALCTLSGVSFHILQTISLYSFFGLSVDRFLSVVFPFRYRTLTRRKNNILAVGLLWLISILMYGTIPTTGIGIYVYKCEQRLCNLGAVNMQYLSVMFLFNLSIFLATYAFNGYVFCVAHKHQKSIDTMQRQITHEASRSISFPSVKATKSIVVALGVFTLCWGPYYATLFYVVLFNSNVTPITEYILIWIAMSDSYLNFFVFLGMYKSFREEFKRMIGYDKTPLPSSSAISPYYI